jgi:adenylate cyclase
MRKRRLYWLTVALPFLLAIVIGISPLPLRSILQNLVFDGYQRLSPRVYDPAAPVRILDIDDESLKRYGHQWPWPRAQLAAIVDQLKAHGALAIAFDFLFAESDQMGIAELVRDQSHEKALSQISHMLEKHGGYDETFAESIKSAPVVLGAVLINSGSQAAIPHSEVDEAQGQLPVKAGFAHAGDDPLLFVHGFDSGVGPIKALADPAPAIGALNWVPDYDRVIRQVPLIFGLKDKIVPSLTAEALRLAQEEGASYFIKSSNASGETAFGAETGIVAIRVGAQVIETQPRGDVRIRFTMHEPRRFIPAWKLLAGEIDPSEIENKIIFIGSSAAALGDMVTTPLDASVPGVEMHAQLLEHILAGQNLVRPDIADGIEMLAMVALSLILMFALPSLHSMLAAVIGGVGVAAMVGGSWWAFIEKGLLIDPVFPTLGASAVFLVGVLTLYGLKQTQERFVREAFGRYVSPAVVHQLAENPEKLILGGENRELTVLFCDLRSFTTLSESFDAQGLTHFLNEYLSPLTDVAISRNGTIDKYIGDAIMAFWNAPLDDPEHARNAALAALDMRAELAKLNERWQARAKAEGRKFPIVRFGVGLNTGDCCVGNLGSTLKFNYSCIGDNVNIASRLEGSTKYFGIDIAANEATRNEAPDLAWLEIDQVLVKGKTVPIGVFMLLGDAELAKTEDFKRHASLHEEMLAAFRNRDFRKAGALADKAAAMAPREIKGIYSFYRERFDSYAMAPPAEDWSAILKLEEK